MDIKKCWQSVKWFVCVFIIPLICITAALIFAPITEIKCAKSIFTCQATTNLFFTKSVLITSHTETSVKQWKMSVAKNPITVYILQIETLDINYDIEKYPVLKISSQLNNYIHQGDIGSFRKIHIPAFWIYYLIGCSVFLCIYLFKFKQVKFWWSIGITIWFMLVLAPIFMVPFCLFRLIMARLMF